MRIAANKFFSVGALFVGFRVMGTLFGVGEVGNHDAGGKGGVEVAESIC